ncbi:CAAX amino terminal protease family protein [Parvimonas sp. KA00067]|uniref:CPBP family intramembrane glutamic endopeptidase n=1 Tax=Parvimonas sp. KA00067 TaxID=1588755 RepID=UPI000792ACF8|nr:CPBP family intramembrane glutamic endopeptidase [Parvimonas sp. KA00067]KXB65529.1 CAAX amino terminal protease family protein [Parvimonas sp. KA00067]
MSESIENANSVSNSDKKTKKFNKKSLFIVLNYFLTPIFIMLICIKILDNQKIMESMMSLNFVVKFFENNAYLIENRESFDKFFVDILGSIATLIAFIIAIFIVKKRTDSISKNKTTVSFKKLFLIGIGLGVFMILWNIIISYTYPLFGLTFKSNNTESILKSLKLNKILLINLLISAPIGEEIAFKYGVFTFFHEIFQDKGKLLKIFLPALVSAFVFAVIHDGLYLVPLYIVPSFIGCLIYEKSKSLMPCILGHFLNNLLAIITLLY